MSWLILSIGEDGVINLWDKAISATGYHSRITAEDEMKAQAPVAQRLGRRLYLAEMVPGPASDYQEESATEEATQ